MEDKTIFFFGHPKAGSTWLGGLFAGISIDLGLKSFYGQYVLPKNQEILKKQKVDVVISQNSSYDILQNLKITYSGLHVIRDPRDICVSSYFSYKKTHDIGNWTELGQLREKLQAMPFNEGMKEIYHFNNGFFKSMHDWNYEDPDIYELKYEDLVRDPEKKLITAFSFLFDCIDNSPLRFPIASLYNRIIFRQKNAYNLLRIKNKKLPIKHIKYINQKLSFNNLAKGRRKGEEDTNSHYRKGIAGDWKNYLSGDLKKEFKTQYGDLLVRLGYEKNMDW